MEQDTLLDDGPPGVSSPPHRKDPIRKELNATPEVLFCIILRCQSRPGTIVFCLGDQPINMELSNF